MASESTEYARTRTMRFAAAPLEREFLEGTSGKAIAQCRFTYFLGLFLYGVFGILDYTLMPEAHLALWAIRFGVVCPLLIAVIVFSYSRHYSRALQWVNALVLTVAGGGIVAMIYFAPQRGGDVYYAGLMLVLMYCYVFVWLRFVFATVVGWGIVVAYEALAMFLKPTELPVLFANSLFLLSANIIGMVACFQLEDSRRRSFMQQRQLRIEEEKAEHLLMNLLPRPIALRLIENEMPIADGFSEVTILFADIVGFTQLSSGMLPRDVVALLNDVFMAFDQLADQYGVEKIKTVGDAYMAVAGLPEARLDHADIIADLALAMLAEICRIRDRTELDIQIRIGISTGPVVAGVIGRKRFLYDVWGDAVNTASRMESFGVAGGIQVSEYTFHRLHGRYSFQPRGPVDVKGKGALSTYLLLGRRQEA